MTFGEFLTTHFPVVVSVHELATSRARSAAERLAAPSYPAGALIECRRSADGQREAVIADVYVELGQRALTNDIRTKEPVALIVGPDDGLPSVWSLRDDFPDVPHLNMTSRGEPKSLCLYDTTWDELAPSWTAKGFLERIRWWLQAAAYGELHGDQQPLEPLMFSGGRLVVSTQVLAGLDQGVHLGGAIYRTDNGNTLFLRVAQSRKSDGLIEVPWEVITIVGPAQQHGRISAGPKNLRELMELLDGMGAKLGEALEELIAKAVNTHPAILGKNLLVLVGFPVQRASEGPVEEGQRFGFLVPRTLGEIGVDIGYLGEANRDGGKPKYGVLLADSRTFVGDLPVTPLEVYEEFSARVAKEASGRDAEWMPRVFLVGAGALGSHLADQLARSGVNRWDVLDADVLLPHNLARHALDGFSVGASKAHALSMHIANLLNQDEGRAIFADFLRPQSASSEIDAAIAGADVILDASASVGVSRSIAFRNHSARGVAMFLNPRATDLVCLFEDRQRTHDLAVLEHYYLRAILEIQQMDDHLRAPDSTGFRYSASCRHPSVQVAGSNITTLAGCGARHFLSSIHTAGATAKVWRIDEQSGAVSAIDIPVGGDAGVELGTWNVRLLDAVTKDMVELRQARLPNETGGVLIGSIDRVTRRVSVVAALPAPSDSEERTTSFIRGVARLRERVAEVSRSTLGHLDYVGEWHSHPRGLGTSASADDQRLYGWVYEELADNEAPPIMAIVGDGDVRVHARVEPRGAILSIAIGLAN